MIALNGCGEGGEEMDPGSFSKMGDCTVESVENMQRPLEGQDVCAALPMINFSL